MPAINNAALIKIAQRSATAILASSALFVAGNAAALSCLQPNFAEEFNRLNAVADVYYVGYGTLTPSEPEPPRVDTGDINRPLERFRRYSFTGGFLTGSAITATRTYRVDTKASCLGPWCGGFPSGQISGLFYLNSNNGQGLSFEFGACPGGWKEQTTPVQVNAIQNCMRQGGCGPNEFNALSAF